MGKNTKSAADRLQTIEQASFELAWDAVSDKIATVKGGVGVCLDLGQRFLAESPRYQAIKTNLALNEGQMHKKAMEQHAEYRDIVEYINKLNDIVDGKVTAHDGKKYQINHNTSIVKELRRWEAQRQVILEEVTAVFNNIMSEEIKNFDEDVMALFEENGAAWDEYKENNK